MFLSAEDIEKEVRRGVLQIEPFDPALLKPTSYVLRLGERFRRWRSVPEPIDPWGPDASAGGLCGVEHRSEIVLGPGEFVLAETMEAVGIPDHLLGLLSTLSHWGRFGVSADGGSWLVSAGYGATRPTPLTLELTSTNPNRLRLQSGMPLCHLVVARVGSPGGAASSLFRSIYEGVETPSPPRLFEEFGKVVGLK